MKVLKGIKKNAFSIALASVVFVAFITLSLFSVRFSTVFYILIAGVLGLMLYFISRIRERKQAQTPPEEPLEQPREEEGKK